MNKYKKKFEPDVAAMQTAAHHDRFASERMMQDFMQAAGQVTPDLPTLASADVQQLRVRLIREELDELIEAYQERDIEAVADGLTYLLYVVLGSFTAHGFNAKALYLAVHQNNMLKIATGNTDDGGKFIKSADHLPPDLYAILETQWRVSPIRAGAEAVTCSMCKATNRQHKVELIKLGEDMIPKIAQGDTYTLELTVLCDGRRVKL